MTRGAAHAQVTKVVVTAGADVVAAGAHVVATASADARDPEDPKEAELNTAPLLSDEAFRGLHARVRALEETPDTATLHALASKAPNSYHQATIYFGLVSETASTATKLSMLALSFALAFLQCAVAGGLTFGTHYTTCNDHSDCVAGYWCAPTGYCDACERADLCARNVTSADTMCHACTNAEGAFVTFEQAIVDRIDAMRRGDWMALLLASIVIACGVFGEVRDTMLCEVAVAAIRERSGAPRGWRVAIALLNMLRLFGFLPCILAAVIALVHFRGASTLAICLNSVAVLFLAELDNLAFSHGLNEKARMEAEEFGRVSVTGEDSRLIDAVKLVCVLTIPAVLLGGVALRGAEGASLSPLPSMVIVMVQSVWCAPAGNLPAGIFWAVLRALRGCCFFYGAALIVCLFLGLPVGQAGKL